MEESGPLVTEMHAYRELFEQFAGHVCAVVMVVGGVVPYIPQYLHIKRTDQHEGFSLYVCLVLIIANTLRIIFWFGHWFETPLLLQSIVMNLTMMAMIHCCVKCRNKTQVLPKKEKIFTDFNYEYFWEWSDFQSYVEFVLTFATFGCMAMYLFLNNKLFVEVVGFAALLTEAMLAAPQFYRNMKAKSTHGMSGKMVCMWLMGDVFKTGYFYVRSSPVQFTTCGCLQVLLDLAVISQCFIYTGKKKDFIN
uniref:Solute carrier family 66 member 2 n=1 Tax=Hirondellea gigas TaxID=1518452 RepID=A0A6A7FU67_9CRUS